MKFKTDLHIHTSDVSQCAKINTEELVESYIKKGYSTLVITNHYSVHTFEHMEDASWQEKNDLYISAYKKALEVSSGRINVLLGMEYRNQYSCNDYLVYGVTEDFIYSNSCDDNHNFINMHLKEFTNLANKADMLVFQAHPFRNNMRIINPSFIDGVEVLNGQKRSDSRNDIAKIWAEKYNLLTCGGSDCHSAKDLATVALVSDFVIENNSQLIKVLKQKLLFESVGGEK